MFFPIFITPATNVFPISNVEPDPVTLIEFVIIPVNV
jgi:hypothetical protein